MILFPDEKSNWLTEAVTVIGRDPDRSRESGVQVSAVLPPLYERYVKVLHGIEANFAYLEKPLSTEEETLVRFAKCQPLRLLLDKVRQRESTNISWCEIATALDLPYAPELSFEWCLQRLEQGCWARYISGPCDGVLTPEEAAPLLATLKQFTAPQPLTFRLAELSVPVIGTSVYQSGSFCDLLALIQEPGYRNLPEYWWPDDLSWCVVSDYDLTFTLVGGSSDLCEALLRNAQLECLEVTPGTRVDIYAPIPATL